MQPVPFLQADEHRLHSFRTVQLESRHLVGTSADASKLRYARFNGAEKRRTRAILLSVKTRVKDKSIAVFPIDSIRPEAHNSFRPFIQALSGPFRARRFRTQRKPKNRKAALRESARSGRELLHVVHCLIWR